MKYLVELIKKKNPEESTQSIEYVVNYLVKEGYISYTVQYHWDIYDFYSKLIVHYKGLNLPKKCAILDTCEHFKLSKAHLYRIINNFSQTNETINEA
jgi:hypothetical protein